MGAATKNIIIGVILFALFIYASEQEFEAMANNHTLIGE